MQNVIVTESDLINELVSLGIKRFRLLRKVSNYYTTMIIIQVNSNYRKRLLLKKRLHEYAAAEIVFEIQQKAIGKLCLKVY